MADKSGQGESRRSQLYKGVAELALLLLIKERTRYGLELLECLNAHARLEVADGTIYPLLHRLERQKLIQSQWKTDTLNGRPRKYYRLTDAGQVHLDGMMVEWSNLREGVEALIRGE